MVRAWPWVAALALVCAVDASARADEAAPAARAATPEAAPDAGPTPAELGRRLELVLEDTARAGESQRRTMGFGGLAFGGLWAAGGVVVLAAAAAQPSANGNRDLGFVTGSIALGVGAVVAGLALFPLFGRGDAEELLADYRAQGGTAGSRLVFGESSLYRLAVDERAARSRARAALAVFGALSVASMFELVLEPVVNGSAGKTDAWAPFLAFVPGLGAAYALTGLVMLAGPGPIESAYRSYLAGAGRRSAGVSLRWSPAGVAGTF